jgi:hypothetical protein
MFTAVLKVLFKTFFCFYIQREIIFTEPDLLIAPESEDNVVSEKAVIIAEVCYFLLPLKKI